MKLTSSYSKSMDAFTFVDEEPLINFEATENMTLADLIPEIDALYGVIQYPSFDCFKEKSICSSTEVKPERKANGVQYDLKVLNRALSQPWIQSFENIALKDANSVAQSTKVEHEYLMSLNETDKINRRNDVEHLLQNQIEKSQQLEDNRDKEKLQLNDKEDLVVLEEYETTSFYKKSEISHVISQRHNDVKLKRWGREQDRKKYFRIIAIKPK